MFDSDECLDGPHGCEGPTEARYALSGSGLTYPRCTRHYAEYAERVQPRMDEIRRRYPQTLPPDFDSTICGETW